MYSKLRLSVHCPKDLAGKSVVSKNQRFIRHEIRLPCTVHSTTLNQVNACYW